MRVHFIAIGGSAMHNLAIALKNKGYEVSGSDDEIREPSLSRLQKKNILPDNIGWFPEKIHGDLDAVILGMHARIYNPELLKANELGLKIYSYPEYLFEASKEKKRVVIGGSHGKTSITSMILHVCKVLNLNVDYMVGAQLDGYDCMVKITDDAEIIVLEGDEYLSSPIDRRPKFHLYNPNVALLSGIAWDHINVFPTFENYVEQFEKFINTIEIGGKLIYFSGDEELNKLAKNVTSNVETIPYSQLTYQTTEEGTEVELETKKYQLKIFGKHNIQNLNGALLVGKEMGISPADFLSAMQEFKGAGKRLEKVVETHKFVLYKDFAHSPSKLKATTDAVKEQYPDRKLIACMELHTFSSLNKEFLSEYKNSMQNADEALVYFNPTVLEHKKLDNLTTKDIAEAFGGKLTVVKSMREVVDFIENQDLNNSVLLMMSSGNFDGINFEELGEKLKGVEVSRSEPK